MRHGRRVGGATVAAALVGLSALAGCSSSPSAAGSHITTSSTSAREQIEVETDEQCAALWAPIGNGVRRLASLIAPINDAFTAAGTYGQLR
jgi:hypothetical protein